jgi:hypothetical protein
MSFGTSETTDVSERWDRVFRVLSQEPRRELVLSLADRSESEWVALPDAALSRHYPESREKLRITLRHKHLPALADNGYVVWRESPLEARRGPNFDELEAVLGVITASVESLPDRLVTGCRRLERRAHE